MLVPWRVYDICFKFLFGSCTCESTCMFVDSQCGATSFDLNLTDSLVLRSFHSDSCN